jgi:hypothetical protein
MASYATAQPLQQNEFDLFVEMLNGGTARVAFSSG